MLLLCAQIQMPPHHPLSFSVDGLASNFTEEIEGITRQLLQIPTPALRPLSWTFPIWPKMNSMLLEKATCSTCRPASTYSDPLKDITLVNLLSILSFLLELFHQSRDIISPTFEKPSLDPTSSSSYYLHFPPFWGLSIFIISIISLPILS